MSETVKEGTFEIFNIHSIAKFQKLKADSLESLIKNFRKKNKT